MNADELLIRSTVGGVEVRHKARQIDVLAVPYETATTIESFLDGDYEETFAAGAFDDVNAARVKTLRDHDTQRLIGRVAALVTKARDGLRATLAIARTALGDETLELAADGSLDVSIGFRPLLDQWTPDRSAVRRLRADLVEISLVPFPAYAGAAVLGVRSHQPLSPATRPASLTPRLDRLEDEQRLERLRALYPERTHP